MRVSSADSGVDDGFESLMGRLRVDWKSLEAIWLSRLEGRREDNDDRRDLSGENAPDEISEDVDKCEVHGRDGELKSALRLILHRCILRFAKSYNDLFGPSVTQSTNDTGTAIPSLFDCLVSNHLSLSGIQISGLPGNNFISFISLVLILLFHLRFW